MSTNKSQFKLTKVNPAYWHATFDNPPINMLGPETMLELQGLVGRFEKDPDLKVVVFDSADPDFFIAHFRHFPRRRYAEGAWPQRLTTVDGPDRASGAGSGDQHSGGSWPRSRRWQRVRSRLRVAFRQP
jgi:hypothetical protein